MQKKREFLYKIRFQLLLISFLLLIFTPLFFTNDFYFDNIQGLVFIVNLFAGINLFYHKKKKIKYGVGFIIIALLILSLNFFNLLSSDNYVFILYLMFFVIVAFQLFYEIFNAKEINHTILFAALCGMVIFGLTGFFIFLLIEFNAPNSFTNLSGNISDKSTDLLYFSYITQTTIGFGDIAPATEFAKRCVMLFGLTCQFYQTIIVAIIIGKYLNQKNND